MPDLNQDQAGAYLAYRQAAPDAAAGDALLKEMSSSPQGEHPQEPTPEPVAPSGAAVPQRSLPARVASDVGQGALEIGSGRAEYTGVRDALESTYDMADDFDQWLEKEGFSGARGLGGDALRNWVDKNSVAAPQSVTGGLAHGVAQFLTGLALTRGAMGAVGLPAKLEGAAGYAYSAVKGALANFASFDPHQGRLSDLIQQYPALQNPVTEWMSSKPGDTNADGRFKNALEGTLGGTLADGLLRGLKLLRGVQGAQTAGAALPEGTPAPARAPSAALRELGDEKSSALVSDKPFNAPEAPPGETPKPEEVAGATAPEKPQIHINFARIDTPEDIHAVLQQMADRYEPSVTEAKRGVQSVEEIKLNASQQNAWDLLANRRVGEALNAEQLRASKELWVSSGDKLKQVAQIAVDSPTEENLFAFRKQMGTHYAIQSQFLGAQAEAGRALRALGIPVGTSSSRLQEMTERLMQTSGGMDNVREMAQFVTDRANAGQDAELDSYLQKGAWARTRDAMLQAFSDGLLTAPKTQTKILASNVSTAMWRFAERYAGEKLGGEIAPGETGAMIHGWLGGFKDALSYAGKSFRSGATGAGIGEPHEWGPSQLSSEALNLNADSVLGRAADFMGNALSFGRRMILAQHDMALTMAYRGELNAQAFRQVSQEVAAGATGKDDFAARMAELLQNPSEAMLQTARDSAKYQAFLDEPGSDTIGKLTQVALEARRQVPALRVIMPFIKIPSRIMSYTFERSPLGLLMQNFRSQVAAGGAQRDLALAQTSMGSMLSLAAADMVLSGNLKGGGSNVAGVEQAEEREGKLRDSIKIGNRWYGINGVHPIGKLMLMAADVAENLTQGQTELHGPGEPGKIVAGTALAIARTLVDNSYFQGISDLFAAVHDATVKGSGSGALLSLGGGAIPAAAAAAARMSDPYQRAVYSMLDEFRSKIPGLSKDLAPRRDLWGDPVPSGHDALTRLLSPVGVSDEQHTPIDDEIVRQGFNLTMPERRQTFGSPGNTVAIDMAKYPHAYSRMLELSGHELKSPAWGMGLKDLLNAIVSGNHPLSGVYRLKSDGPEGGKEVMIRDLISQYRDAAKRQLLDEYPALSAEVSRKQQAQAALQLGGVR